MGAFTELIRLHLEVLILHGEVKVKERLTVLCLEGASPTRGIYVVLIVHVLCMYC